MEQVRKIPITIIAILVVILVWLFSSNDDYKTALYNVKQALKQEEVTRDSLNKLLEKAELDLASQKKREDSLLWEIYDLRNRKPIEDKEDEINNINLSNITNDSLQSLYTKWGEQRGISTEGTSRTGI